MAKPQSDPSWLERYARARVMGHRADERFKIVCQRLAIDRFAALRAPLATIAVAQAEIEAAS